MGKDIQYTNLLKKQISTFQKEKRFLEFKSNYQDADKLGRYISALSNGACLENLDFGYLYFGVDDDTLEVKPTTFDCSKVKAAGMNREQLAASLKKLLEEKSVVNNEAVVTVEYLNLGFSVLGEVQAPGFYPFENDRTNVLQALGMAHDLNIYGRRDAIKVIRTEDGQQKTYVLNLLDTKQLTSSPAYYLQQNDIVYVEPNNYRKRQSSANATEITTASFWLSALSVLTTIAVLVFK